MVCCRPYVDGLVSSMFKGYRPSRASAVLCLNLEVAGQIHLLFCRSQVRRLFASMSRAIVVNHKVPSLVPTLIAVRRALICILCTCFAREALLSLTDPFHHLVVQSI